MACHNRERLQSRIWEVIEQAVRSPNLPQKKKKKRKQKAREEQGINGFGSSESIAQLTTCKTKWLISKNDGALNCWMHMKALEVTKMYNTEVYRKEL